MSVLKYRNPNYVEGGDEPKWISLGLSGSSSGDSSDGSGDGGSGDGKQYETVNVSISADNGTSITANVTVNGETKSVTSGSSVPFAVEYGTEYTVEVSAVEGYVTPDSVTFTAGQSTRNVVLVYNRIAVSYITINQNITDPATMVSGDVRGEAIQLIRANSHRYLGKYTADNTMTVCQLDDADSNYYPNGSKAYLDGDEGDVFMKLPKFWWKCYEENEGSNVWTIGFAYGAVPDDTWKEWADDELIGVFPASDKGTGSGKFYSIKGGGTTMKTNSVPYLSEYKGNGFSFLKLKHYNILRLLFLAYYGTTDSQSVLGNGHSIGKYNTTFGMSDSIYDGEDSQIAMFWGISSVFSDDPEFIHNAEIADNSTTVTVTEDDGTTRELTLPESSQYVKELVFGEYGDCVAKSGVDGASATTGYCDYYDVLSSTTEKKFLCFNYNEGKYSGMFCMSYGYVKTSPYYNFSGRITFKGTIIEETDVEAFRLIEITN